MKISTIFKGIEIWDGIDCAEDPFFANYGVGSNGFPRYIGGNSVEEVCSKIQDAIELQTSF